MPIHCLVNKRYWPVAVTTSVELSSDQAFATLALPTATPVSIPLRSGDPLYFDTCYSDPEWIQPSFDRSTMATEFLYAQWPSTKHRHAKSMASVL